MHTGPDAFNLAFDAVQAGFRPWFLLWFAGLGLLAWRLARWSGAREARLVAGAVGLIAVLCTADAWNDRRALLAAVHARDFSVVEGCVRNLTRASLKPGALEFDLGQDHFAYGGDLTALFASAPVVRKDDYVRLTRHGRTILRLEVRARSCAVITDLKVAQAEATAG